MAHPGPIDEYELRDFEVMEGASISVLAGSDHNVWLVIVCPKKYGNHQFRLPFTADQANNLSGKLGAAVAVAGGALKLRSN